MLEFTDVSKTFPDGTDALASTTFAVAPGEFVTIVGPSGCGKSTLLRIASGLDAPIERDASRRPAQPRLRVPGRRRCCSGARCAATSSCSPSWRASTAAERARRVADNVRLVGLEGFEDKYPKQLSGGMKMRASLARSLLMEPAMFLFDEPFGALDEITRERLNDELLALFQRKGFGALFITHSISEAVFLSTRVLVMSARPGRLIGEFDVPFAYPRSPDLRFEPAFAELCGEVSHALRGGTRERRHAADGRGAGARQRRRGARRRADAPQGWRSVDRHRRAGDRARRCSSACGG